MTIVYLYTALCTVGGADRSIIQKRTIWLTKCIRMYLLSQIHKRTPARFPDISQNQAH